MPEKLCNSTKELSWDSDFFSKKIAAIYMEVNDDDYLLENLQKYKQQGFDLIYIFSNTDTRITIPHVPHVDCKVIYKLDLLSGISGNPDDTPGVLVFDGEPTELYSLGLQAGEYSRYKRDTHFKKEDFEYLYKVWIDNSINQGFADRIFVFKENDCYQGFITLKKKDNELEIGLIATDVQFRGKGIAKKLIDTAKKYALENGCKTLSVATQKDNKQACMLYEKCGMSLYSETDIYHAWLK